MKRYSKGVTTTVNSGEGIGSAYISTFLYYTLDKDNNAVKCSLQEWADLYENTDGRDRRLVGHDHYDNKMISTVFLGLDHNYFGGEPLIFETMIFDEAGEDGYMERYSTWVEAKEGHNRAIQWVKNGCKDDD